MSVILLLLFSFLSLFSLTINTSLAECTGKFVNPITDICWSCFFPMTVGSIPVFPGNTPDIAGATLPVCLCPKGGIPLPGLTIGIWEPIALIDVSKEPFCFVNLGGLELGKGLLKLMGSGTQNHGPDDSNKSAFHYTHYYKYPASLLLNIVLDAGCLSVSGFDIAYMSEVDPSWKDDSLALILNPEAIAFTNIIAQGACAADCAASSIGIPLDFLFWCAGCQGGIYPLSGRGVYSNIIQNTVLMAEKTIYKMHRMLMLFDTSSFYSICQPTLAPIIKKSQYRTQIVNPVPATSTLLGCQPFGRTSTFYEMGRTIPFKGENYGYMIWRKRNCCLL